MSLAVCEKACFQTDKWTMCVGWVWLQERDIPAADRLRHQVRLLSTLDYTTDQLFVTRG
jgi:hypothetical protein